MSLYYLYPSIILLIIIKTNTKKEMTHKPLCYIIVMSIVRQITYGDFNHE